VPALLLLFVVIAGCDKTKLYKTKIADTQAHFIGSKNQQYNVVVNPAPAYTITLGTTDVADVDRTVTIKVTSPTGASATQYTLSAAGNTVTIPKGQATATFNVQANFAAYTTGRKDTLIFTIQEPSIKSASFSDTVKLALRGPCFEGGVVLSDFIGAYANTVETFATNPPYGPYRTTISSVNQLTATTGTITVNNIWDNGWGPITFTLDWTDPANRTATVVSQAAITGSDAGDISATYAGQTIAVRPFAGSPGTFSWCSGTLTLKMQLGVTGVGFFNALYTVNLAR